jgi:hypothetical protein
MSGTAGLPEGRPPTGGAGPPAAARLDLQRARGAGEILGAALELYGRYWWQFLAMAFAVVAPIDIVLYGLVGGQLTSPDAKLSPYASALVAIEPIVLTIPLVTAVHVRAVMAVGRGERPDVIAALREGLLVLPAVCWPITLAFLGVVAGLICLIIPGIWLTVRWAFAAQSVVVDDLRGVQALRRSAALVDGGWWRVFGLIVLLNLVGGGIATLIARPLQAAADSAGSGPLLVLGTIIGEALPYSFFALAGTVLFFDLRARARGVRPRAGVPEGMDHPERVR